MVLLVAGLVVFFGIHFLPATPLRGQLLNSLGEAKYKGLFSLASAIGLVMIVLGFRQSEFVLLWSPEPIGRTLAFALMPVATILVVASNMPNNIKRWLHHPMLLGIVLWGAVHLLANGDLASTLIFASFLSFAIIDIFLVETSGRYQAGDAVSFVWDIATVVVGLGLFAVLFGFHHHFTGMRLY